MNTTSTKKFNLTVSPLWETEGGNLISLEINPEIYDALQKVKIGGKLFVKTNAAKNKHAKSPQKYLEYMSVEDVAAFKANNPGYSGRRDDSL